MMKRMKPLTEQFFHCCRSIWFKTGPLLEGRTLGVGDQYIKNLGQVETVDRPIKHPNESVDIFKSARSIFRQFNKCLQTRGKKDSACIILVQK